jgi:DNA ligase-1
MMLLQAVVEASAQVAATRSRKAKIATLAAVIAQAQNGEVPAVVGFLSGEPRQGKIGVGYAAAYSADVEPADESSITVEELDRAIEQLRTTTGEGSQAARSAAFAELLFHATAEEQDFIRALLTGGLRQGALEGVMVEGIARATEVPAGAVRRALMLQGDLSETAQIAVVDGAFGLEQVGLVVGRGVRPMLASTCPDPRSAIDQIGEAVVDWKLDGARIQVHRVDRDVVIFTRNLNDVTDRLPEVVDDVRTFEADSFILDGEAMGLSDEGQPLRFQETMSRFGAEELREDVPLHPFFFDILHLDGEDLIDLPLSDRLARLQVVVPPARRIPSVVTDDPQEAERTFQDALAHRHEGVMVKSIQSTYAAGRRGASWLKVKPVHTLDLVILAAEWGHGRRTGWLSNLHLGARDAATGGFVMLGKTFKGLTDEMLTWQTERLLELEVRRTKNVVHVRPELVAEIALDGFLPSPRYPGGVALRFARVRGYRPDKRPEDADTMEAVMAIYRGESG